MGYTFCKLYTIIIILIRIRIKKIIYIIFNGAKDRKSMF